MTTQEIPIQEEVLNIPGRDSPANLEVLFQASNLPALGSKFFSFQMGSSEDEGKKLFHLRDHSPH